MTGRDFSVFPVWIVGAAQAEYLKVRALQGTLGIGKRVEVQVDNVWLAGRVVEPREQSAGHVWIQLTGHT